MGAPFNPANRTKGGIRWGLVAHTVAMFSFVTISTAMNLDIQSFSYIDNREFPGNGGMPPGPLGYQFLIHSKATSVVPSIMFILNQWLADGLLVSSGYNSVGQASNSGPFPSSISYRSESESSSPPPTLFEYSFNRSMRVE